ASRAMPSTLSTRPNCRRLRSVTSMARRMPSRSNSYPSSSVAPSPKRIGTVSSAMIVSVGMRRSVSTACLLSCLACGGRLLVVLGRLLEPLERLHVVPEAYCGLVLPRDLLDGVHRPIVGNRVVDDTRQPPLVEVALQVDGVRGEDEGARVLGMGDHTDQTRGMARPMEEVQIRRQFEVVTHHDVVVQIRQVKLDLGIGAGEIERAGVGHLQGVRQLVLVDDNPPATGLGPAEEVKASAVVHM